MPGVGFVTLGVPGVGPGAGGVTWRSRMLALTPWRYFPIDEAVGAANATDVMAGATAGATNVEFGVPGYQGGAARFTDSTINLLSALTGFDGSETAFGFWVKQAAGAWEDEQNRLSILLYADAANFLQIYKLSTANTYRFYRKASNQVQLYDAALSTYDWYHVGFTVSEDRSFFKFLINGVPLYEQPKPLAWTGSLTAATFGRGTSTPSPANADQDELLFWNHAISVRDMRRAANNPYPVPVAVFLGDSVTVGTGASDAAHRWVNIVAAATGYTPVNAGIAGTMLQNSVQNSVATVGAAAENNGRDTYHSRLTSYGPDWAIILYGLNDLRLNDAGFSVEAFESDLGEVVDGIVAQGTSANHIVIGSPPYMNPDFYASYAPSNGGSIEKHAAYVAACASVAAAKSTRYADVYAAMLNNGANTLIGADGIHPNNAGHAMIAATFLSVLS